MYSGDQTKCGQTGLGWGKSTSARRVLLQNRRPEGDLPSKTMREGYRWTVSSISPYGLREMGVYFTVQKILTRSTLLNEQELKSVDNPPKPILKFTSGGQLACKQDFHLTTPIYSLRASFCVVFTSRAL